MSSTMSTHAVVVFLDVQRQNRMQTIEMQAGERLFIGADERSDLQIDGADIAPTHCVIVCYPACVVVEDCYSPAGTFVSGQKIRSVRVEQDTCIKIGSAVISLRFQNGTEQHDHRQDLPSSAPSIAPLASPSYDVTQQPVRQTPQSNLNAGNSDLTEADHDKGVSDESRRSTQIEPGAAKMIAELQWQLLQAQEENRTLTKRLGSLAATSDSQNVADPFHDEMLELLRSEVIELQAELAQQQQAMNIPATGDVQNDDVLSREDSQRLLERLEQLLGELQTRDEQVAMLSELLEAAEETNRLESEERAQIDNWLKDIELRFGSREQEWQAERDALNRTIASIIAERDRAENAVKADSANGKLEAANNLLQALRDTADQQRRQLQESEQTIADLRRRLEQSKGLQSREERVELAQLRAEIARQKQELEAVRLQNHRGPVDESALKLKALRQHLNEIHEVERAERAAEREEKKLSNRLAKIWRRLESR